MNGREPESHKPVLAAPTPIPVDKKFPDVAAKRPNGIPPRVVNNGQSPFRGYRVAVHNLHASVTWRDLKDFLRMAGEVRFADVVRPGMGIGEFGTPQERATVIRALNGKELNGTKVVIKCMNETDPRFQGFRSFPPYVQHFIPEPGMYGLTQGPTFEGLYEASAAFEPYPAYSGGGPLVGPMEYPPVPFPPPPRLPPWPPTAGRGGRVYPPFAPPYPPNAAAAAANFGRGGGGHIRPNAGMWGVPPGPPRPCAPGRAFERPPPPVLCSQPAPPLRTPEFVEQHEEPPYARIPVTLPPGGMTDGPPEHLPYEDPPMAERDYRGYSSGRYQAPVEAREKPNPEYNGRDDWNGYFYHHRETQSDSTRYTKYDPPQTTVKPEPDARPPPPYPHMDDPRLEYSTDYTPNRSVTETIRKDYGRSGGYTGYLMSSASYPKSGAEQAGGGKYDYGKSRLTSSDEYKYRMEDYSRGSGGGGGGGSYPSSEVYHHSSKEHHRSTDYDYSRTEPRSYASDYKSREATYYDRGRSTDHAERSYRDDDSRGAGGVERTRQRPSHRTGPYDR